MKFFDGNSWERLPSELTDLGDVILSSPADNQFLRFNGTNWVNETVPLGSGFETIAVSPNLPSGEGTRTTLDASSSTALTGADIAGRIALSDVGDVDITSPLQDNDILVYNITSATDREWQPMSPSEYAQHHDLDDVGDVHITTPTHGAFLRWDNNGNLDGNTVAQR